jgi:membrane protease YdiL (CAAX protease family)
MPADMRMLRPWQAWLLFFAGGLVAQLAGLVIVVVVAGVLAARSGTLTAEGVAAAAASLPALGAALVSTGLVLIGAALLTLRLARVPRAEGLGLERPRPAAIAAACLGVVGLGPVSEVVLSLAQRVLPGLTLGTLDSINSAVLETPLWVTLPVVALLPGLSEELFFRGAFQRAFGAGAKAIAISGVAFAAFHVDPHHALAILPVGLFLAWTAARTGTVWVPVIAHVVNNALSITLTRLGGARSSEPGVITSPWWLVLGGVAMVVAAGIWLQRVTAGAERDGGNSSRRAVS